MAYKELTQEELLLENEDLRLRLGEAEDALNAIRNGDVDAIVVSGKEGDQVFSLSGAETPYRILLEEMQEGAITLNADGTIQYCNERFAGLLSVPKETIPGSKIGTYVHDDSRPDLLNLIKKASKGRASKVITFFRNSHKTQVNLKISASKLPEEMSGDICLVASDVSTLISYQDKLEIKVKNRTQALNRANQKLEKDLVEIRKSKEALQESKNRLSSLYNSMSEGLAIHELILDESGKPADYRFVDVNPAFEMITRLNKKKTLGRKATEVFALNEAPYLETYSNVAIKGEEVSFETYFPPMEKHFSIGVFSPEKGKFATIFQDITERKLLEESTLRQNSILGAINHILEAVLYSLNEEELGNACLDIAQKITESKFGFICKINAQGLEEIAISNPGWDDCNILDKKGHSISGISFKIHGIYGRVISDGKSLIANDPAHHPDSIGLPKGHPLLESFLGVPLIKNGKTIGIIALGNRSGGYGNTEQDTIEAIVSTIVEAFDRKSAEEGMRQSEENARRRAEELSSVLNAVPAAVWIAYDSSGLDIRGNKLSYQWLQIPEGANSSKSAAEGVRPETFRMFKDGIELSPSQMPVQLSAAGLEINNYEFDFVYPDKSVRHILGNATPLFDEKGTPRGSVSAFIDITQRKKSEEALKKNEKLIRSVLDNVNSGVALIDETGSFTVCNPLFLKLFGLSEDSSIKNVNDQNWAEWKVFNEDGTLLNVDDHPVRKAALTGKQISQQLVGMNLPAGGDTIWMLISAEPILKENDEIEKIICTYHDITARRKAEEMVRESEERYRNLFSAMPSGVIVYEVINEGNDPNGKDFIFKDINPAGEKIDQVRRADIIGKSLYDFFPNVKEMGLVEVLKRVWQTGVPEFFPVTLYSDNKISLWVTNYIWRLPSGELVALFDDITESKRMENALKMSEERFRLALKNAPIGVAIQDRNLVYTWAYNQKSLRPEEIIGKTDADLFAAEDLVWINPLKATILKTGEEMNVEKWLTSNGRRFFLGIHYEPIKDLNGNITGIGAATINLTERKLIEEALSKSEEKFSSAFRNSPNAITITQLNDGKIIEGNESVYSLLGYHHEDIIGKTTLELGIWVDLSDRERLTQTLATKGFIQNEDFVLRKKDGTHITVNLSASLIKIGNEQCFLSSFIDLTDRKKAEEALHNSEELLRTTLSSIGDAVLSVDILGKIVFLNPVAVKLLGWELEEVRGRQVQDVFRIINEITLMSAADIVQQVLLEGKVLGLSNHTSLITRDGRHIPIDHSAAPIKDQYGNVIGAVLVFHDVTEKRKAGEALEASLVKYKTLFDCLPLGITVSDEKGQIIESNRLSEVLLGLTKDEQEQREIHGQEWQLIAPDGAPMSPDDYASVRALKENRLIENVEMGVIKADNSITWINVTATPILLDGYGVLIIYNDITGRKNMEDKLRESEERFRSLVKNAPTAIYEIDFATRKFTSVNDSMCKLSGYSREELFTVDVLDLLDEDSRKLFLSRISNSFKREKPEEYVEYKVKGKDGRMIDAILNMKFNYNEKGIPVGAMVVGHDITERKKAEQALIQSEVRLKELIATKDKFFNIVAHDLKNPFTSLIGSSELLYENINKLTPENVKSLASLLNDSAKNGYSILQNLLDWSRSQTGLLKIYPEKLNLRKLVAENMSGQALAAKNKDISIIIESVGDIYLTTDKNMIDTILRNLLSNSIKFTQKFGEVVVSLRKESGSITILVKDNGVGISPDRIGVLFKLDSRNSTPGTENEQGTGLGLKLIKELVEKLGGNIFVESVLGYGSTFWIKLPEEFGDRLLNI